MIISFGTAVESKMKPIVNRTIPSLAPENGMEDKKLVLTLHLPQNSLYSPARAPDSLSPGQLGALEVVT